MSTATVIELVLSAVVFAIALIIRCAVKKDEENEALLKINKKRRTVMLVIMLISGWFFIGTLISQLSGMKTEMNVEFDMFSTRTTVNIFGNNISFADTTLLSFIITGIITVLALIFRFIVFPKFSENPKGFQNIMELCVEAVDNFTKSNVADYSNSLSPYLFSLAIYMLFCAAAELFGLRAPTSDLITTFALGLITFVLINFYGIKKKGVGGRIKALSEPTPIILPMKILSDVAVPVSLACRLFGNMLGGMIVMDLLKGVLGGYATGIPAIAGLYFNLFHPLIQIYIFGILSLTFINEAIE